MSLKLSYTLLAPLYDVLLSKISYQPRRNSLQRLAVHDGDTVLISGIGSGLDIPHLIDGPSYHGIDLTFAMLKRAKQQRNDTLQLYQGDVMALPFSDNSFDAIVMHLILAVVPTPLDALHEAERVLKPGGKIFILDKFLKRGRPAPLRRLISPISGLIATRLDVVFEELLEQCPSLELKVDQPALLNGWFRMITLEKSKSLHSTPPRHC